MLRRVSELFIVVGSAVALILQWKHAEGNIIKFGNCLLTSPEPTLIWNPFVASPHLTTSTGHYGLATKVWYEVRRYQSKFDHSLVCVRYKFTTATQKAPYTTSLTIFGTNKTNGRSIVITGLIYQKNEQDFSKWKAIFLKQGTFAELPFKSYHHTSNFNVVAADAVIFPSWIVIYTCHQFPFFYVADSWILFDTRFPPLSKIRAALTAVGELGLPVDKYVASDQQHC